MNNSNQSENLYDDIIYVDDDSTQPAKDENPDGTHAPHTIPMRQPWERQIFHLPAGDMEEVSAE